MQFFWFGQSFIKIETKETKIFLDPWFLNNKSVCGEESDIVVSLENSDSDSYRGTPFIINKQGEFESRGALFLTMLWGNKKKALVSRIDVDNISILNLGQLSEMPSKEELEGIEKLDILLLPVGGRGVLDHKMAVELVQLLEPKIVIPINYNINNNFPERDNAEAFLKNLGVKASEMVDKFSIKWQDLGEDELSVVILKNQN